MTVEELIEALEQYPTHANVLIETADRYYRIDEIEMIEGKGGKGQTVHIVLKS